MSLLFSAAALSAAISLADCDTLKALMPYSSPAVTVLPVAPAVAVEDDLCC